MIRKIYDSDAATLSVIASGKLTDFEYQSVLIPQLEQAIRQSGKINLLWKMEDFQGWEIHAAWDELVLALKTRDAIERIALVGEEPWQQKLQKLLQPLTHAEVQYYDQDQYLQAQQWVRH